MSMVGAVTTAFCSWTFLVRQWSGRSRRRTATRTGVRWSLTGMEGWSPSPGWSAVSVHDGRPANPVRKCSAKMTGSLVISSEVTVLWLATPLNRRDRSCSPISATNRSMMRWASLEERRVSSMMEGWYG